MRRATRGRDEPVYEKHHCVMRSARDAFEAALRKDAWAPPVVAPSPRTGARSPFPMPSRCHMSVTAGAAHCGTSGRCMGHFQGPARGDAESSCLGERWLDSVVRKAVDVHEAISRRSRWRSMPGAARLARIETHGAKALNWFDQSVCDNSPRAVRNAMTDC